jgi:potassium efflux system protein
MTITPLELDWLKENIEKVDFLKVLTSEQMARLLAGVTAKNVAGGDIVIHQGQRGDTFFLIYNGRVSVWYEKNNKRVKLSNLNKGEFFGEISLLSGRPVTATVKASRQTRVFFIDSEGFLSLVRENQDLAQQITSVMNNRLADQKKAAATLVDENLADISSAIQKFLAAPK